MDSDNKILLKAEEMFMSYGVKSVTMDDLSRALGISKKTLYQYVDNKEDLINKVLSFFLMRESEVMKQIRMQATDAIEEVILISRHINKILRSLNPAAMYDLQKYYGEQYQLLRSLNDELVYNVITENIKKGIEEGMYRNDFNLEIIAKFYVGHADTILDTDIFPTETYNRIEVHREFVMYHLNAITTPEGKQRILAFFDGECE